MELVSFDPGLRKAGLARFSDGRLVACWYVDADCGQRGVRQWLAMAHSVVNIACMDGQPDKFAFETMSTRKGKEAAHGNLFDLTMISGLCAGSLLPYTVPLPVPANTWTRGRGKAVNAALMRNTVLDEDEVAVLDATLKNTPKNNHKEVTDAIGIGLYASKRWL